MIPASHADLLGRPLAAVLSTVQPDGRPQASVVWFDATDAVVRINSERGRAKVRNVERDPRVTIVIVDPSDQHRYIEIRGDVVSIAEAGALEHRAALDCRYLGPDHRSDPTVDKGARVIITIAPVQVHAYG